MRHWPRKDVGTTNLTAFSFKNSVVMELEHTPVVEISEKYGIPRSTIWSWENQLRMKNKAVPIGDKGRHLRSGSGRKLSYPKEVDEEILEWILIRRDAQLPVSSELIKAKAKLLIKPHNQQFKASKGWLQKFLPRHSLSMRSRTSISQKLPIQLESKLQGFLNEIRVLRERHGYSSDMIINMDETPIVF